MFSLTIARICLIHIYRFLDRKTSAAFRAVCRDWREAYDYECTSLALNASLADRVSEFPSFRIFEVPCFGRVRCMNVLFTIRRDVEEIAKADNVYAHIALAKIRHEVRRWVHVLSGFTALTSLSFRLDNDSDKSVLALRPHFPAQITIEMYSDLQRVLCGMPSLTSLNLSLIFSFSYFGESRGVGVELYKVLASVPQLTSLDLSRCKGVSNEVLSLLATMPYLVSLQLLYTFPSITFPYNLQEEWTREWTYGMATICKLSSINKLSFDDLSYDYQIRPNDDDVRSIASSLSQLTSLNLTWCWHLSEYGWRELAKITSLSELILKNTHVTDDVLVALADTLPDLAIIDLSSCYYVTRRGLLALGSLTGLCELNLNSPLTAQKYHSFAELLAQLELDDPDPNPEHDIGPEMPASVLSGFARFPALTRLGMESQRIDLQGQPIDFLALGNLTGLRELNLMGCDVRPSVIPAIARLTGLRKLNLYDCTEVTKDHVKMLFASCTAIDSLYLENIKVYR
jgi:Leucine-rich repeat (LRR) protein